MCKLGETMKNLNVLCFDCQEKRVFLYWILLSWLFSRLPLLAPLLSCSASSHQIELLQVVSEDGVFDGHEDEADVFCVCSAGEVRVQGLVLVRVLFLVHFQDEFLSSCWILLRSCDSGLNILSVNRTWKMKKVKYDERPNLSCFCVFLSFNTHFQ